MALSQMAPPQKPLSRVFSVGGKTGTAENAPGEPAHAWFVGLAPSEESRVAVAVVLQNGGGATEVSGNSLAAPIAAAVMRAVQKQ